MGRPATKSASGEGEAGSPTDCSGMASVLQAVRRVSLPHLGRPNRYKGCGPAKYEFAGPIHVPNLAESCTQPEEPEAIACSSCWARAPTEGPGRVLPFTFTVGVPVTPDLDAWEVPFFTHCS